MGQASWCAAVGGAIRVPLLLVAKMGSAGELTVPSTKPGGVR